MRLYLSVMAVIILWDLAAYCFRLTKVTEAKEKGKTLTHDELEKGAVAYFIGMVINSILLAWTLWLVMA